MRESGGFKLASTITLDKSDTLTLLYYKVCKLECVEIAIWPLLYLKEEWCESNVKGHVSAFKYVLIDSFWKKKIVKLFRLSAVQTCCTHCFKIVVIAKNVLITILIWNDVIILLKC